MVRPILEYGDVLYDNTTIKNKLKLDNIQRKAAIICTGAYRHTETRSLLHELACEPLATRRTNHKIIQFFKIINHIYPSSLLDLINQRRNDAYNLRNSRRFLIYVRRTETSNRSFFPSTARLWNTLPGSVTNAITVSSLKTQLNIRKPKPVLYYRLCSGKLGILVTRLRLGLSALNSHRHKYNFIDSPICPKCYNGPETPEHFFFTCNSYLLARNKLYDRLISEINIDAANLNHRNLLNILIHGLVDVQYQTNLLNIVQDYLQETKRFA